MNTTRPRQKLDIKYQPSTLADFIGVATPKAVLSAWLEDPCSDSFILYGESGTGKTTMAHAVGKALGAQPGLCGGLVDVPAGECDKDKVLDLYHHCHYAPLVGSFWWVIVVNEADRMTKQAQDALLSKLDCSDPCPNTVWFFTTNDLANLEDRFISRSKVLRFTVDGLLEPGIKLLRKIWRAERKGRPEVDPPDFAAILKAARFNVREALNIIDTEILAPGSFVPLHENAALRNFKGRIFAWGYSGKTKDDLALLLQRLRIDKLIDVRFNPKTQVPGFDGDTLERAHPDLYVAAGAKLGGRGHTTEAGLGWLTALAEDGARVLLLSSERLPASSHRYTEIALPLLARGVEVQHVCDDELFLTSDYKSAVEHDRGYHCTIWQKEEVA